MAEQRTAADAAPPKCAQWLSKKGRFCASPALPNAQYCGNHKPCAGERRVSCPIDPSHTVLEKDVPSHLQKCSAVKQLKISESQSYFFSRVNAGSDEESCERAGHQHQDADKILRPKSFDQSCSAKRSTVCGLSGDAFWELVYRIEAAHEACGLGTEDRSVLLPSRCSKWWNSERDRRWPLQGKHASQQASLLGNLDEFGLLPTERTAAYSDTKLEINSAEKSSWVYVEFGAGRGYLTHMLCASYGVSTVVLVERRAYRFKADRTLRQMEGISVDRLRTDIEDLNIHGVKPLQKRHFVAISKHLCGPATDLALRCCLNKESSGSSEAALEGIGIATCCHHLCQWRSYVNKAFFFNLGFSLIDFNMITWLTSWAVNESGNHSQTQLDTGSDQNLMSRQADRNSIKIVRRAQLSEVMTALDPAKRVVLGQKCKDILDHGRVSWLRQHGLDAKLVTYISQDISPENRLILARRTQF